jgi:hypothetical protein
MIPKGKYPNSRGRTWAVAPRGKHHLTVAGTLTKCGKVIPAGTGWSFKARDEFAPENGLPYCRSCL